MAALSQTAASFIPSSGAQYSPFYVIGATIIAAGQPCYVDTAGLLQLTDSNASIAASACDGLAALGGSVGQSARLVTSDANLVLGSTLVIGDTVWTHTTAGAITKTAADNTTGVGTCCLGVAKSTTVLNFRPLAAGALTP
jgi:hypothetical protein